MPAHSSCCRRRQPLPAAGSSLCCEQGRSLGLEKGSCRHVRNEAGCCRPLLGTHLLLLLTHVSLQQRRAEALHPDTSSTLSSPQRQCLGRGSPELCLGAWLKTGTDRSPTRNLGGSPMPSVSPCDSHPP